MNDDCIFTTNFMLELSDRFNKWLTFNVTNSFTNFDDSYFSFFCIVVSEKC